MILYHGTTEVIKYPDISFSKDYLDFGKGFYLTTFQEQAEKWPDFACACRRGERGCITNQTVLKNELIYQRSYQVER